MHCFFFLSSQLRLSFVNDVFDFNTSLNDVAPTSPISFPVDLMRMEKNRLFMDAICMLFLLFSPSRSSFVSVVVDCNASLIEIAPASPMLVPGDLMQSGKE